MTRKIYLVTSGEYSDFSVHFACLTRKWADDCVKHLNTRPNNHELYEVQERQVVQSTKELRPVTWYRVEVDVDGTERRRFKTEIEPWHAWWEEGQGYALGVAGHSPTAFGTSRRGYSVALKAARDAMARHKAEKAGIV